MDKWTFLSSWYKNLYTHPNPIMIAGIVVIEPQPKTHFVEQTFYDVKKAIENASVIYLLCVRSKRFTNILGNENFSAPAWVHTQPTLDYKATERIL